MTSRDEILASIRNSLAGAARAELPPVAEVWPRENPSIDAMAERFARELQAVHGEAIRCRTMAEAQATIQRLLDEAGASNLGAVDQPLCRELTSSLMADRVAWAQPDWTPAAMAALPVGLVAAEHLLADTGTAMVACRRPEQRLMCYLPPLCVVAARAEQLAEHLPAAWTAIAAEAARPELRGEFLFVTGPSRTADIEKILILGVHGPKRLVVLIVG